MTCVYEGLVGAVHDDDHGVRAKAIDALVAVGQRARPVLRDRLDRETDPGNLALLARAMGTLGDDAAVPRLSRLLLDSTMPELVRGGALEGLEMLDHPAALTARVALCRGAGCPGPLLARAIRGLGRQGQLPAPVVAEMLHVRDDEVRSASLESVVRIPANDRLIEGEIVVSLSDPSASVRAAAIGAAARLGLRETIPMLLEMTRHDGDRPAALAALATLPDRRALSVFVDGLNDRRPETRAASEAALLAIREQVRPDLESLVRAGTLPPSAALVVERVLADFAPIADWRVIGPFPRNTAPLFLGDPAAIDFARPAPGVGGTLVSWHERHANSESGRLSLDDLKGSGSARASSGYDVGNPADLACFACAELLADRDRTALLLIGSSGTITVRVNGDLAWHADHASGRIYRVDSDRVPIKLKRGINRIIVKSREGIGPWLFGVRVSAATAAIQSPRAEPPRADRLRDFALAHAGDSRRGETLFFAPNGIGCARCHSAAGKGGATVGPDLAGLAQKYDRAEIIRSVLEPSSRIVSGYQPLVLALANGTVVSGLLRGETDSHVDLIGPDLSVLRIKTSDIEERRASDVSMMPAGLADPLTPLEFADLIAFLTSIVTPP